MLSENRLLTLYVVYTIYALYEPIVRTTIQSVDYDDPVNKDMFGYKVGLYSSTNGGIQ